MTFYMLRDKKTGLFYKRVHGRSGAFWVPQKKASVWTTPAGVNSAKGGLVRRSIFRGSRSYSKPETEIVTLSTVGDLKVTFVDGDDWEGLYLNGVLVEEGHHVRLEDVMRHLGIPYNALCADQEWLEERGRLPKKLDDVKTA